MGLDPYSRSVDSKKLECGFRLILAGFRSSPGFGIGGQSYSNFLVFYCNFWIHVEPIHVETLSPRLLHRFQGFSLPALSMGP